MTTAYADPPYIGQAKKHYSHDPQCAEVDHYELLTRLREQFPEGWALSLSSPSTEEILHICRAVFGPNKVRVSAWVKPFASFKRGVNPAYAWEPVIWKGGRSAKDRGGQAVPTIRDWHSANITLKKGLSGAKPESFCRWLFDLLGMETGDTLVDLFPGSGIVSSTWEQYSKECRPCRLAKFPPHGSDVPSEMGCRPCASGGN